MPRELSEYDDKRDFQTTPEPPAVRGETPSGRLFVVHKHAATRLHYDLRLEHEGVLLSWAVPRGPSLDTKQRRLAIRVEDHPVEYGSFEGVIPQGEYGGGTVMLWDTGTWSPHGDVSEALAAGKLVFDVQGSKMHGRFGLIHTGARKEGKERNQWLLIKERDDHVRPTAEWDVTAEEPHSAWSGRTMDEISEDATLFDGTKEAKRARPPSSDEVADVEGARKAPTPDLPTPQLASLAGRPPSGDGWLHEIKHDGYRVMIRLDDGVATVFTREGQDWTHRFPTLARAVEDLPIVSAVIDAEAVYVGPDGLSDFGALQAVLNGGDHDSVFAYCFDLPYAAGFDLTDSSLAERKRLLEALLGTSHGAKLIYSEHLVGDHDQILRSACDLGAEGIVSKRADAPYREGRSTTWLKSKCVHREEFVIVGYAMGKPPATGVGSLLLAQYEDSDLVYVGRVGSGIADSSSRSLQTLLAPLVSDASALRDEPDDSAGVVWVEPEVVVEVAFAGWTRSRRLRHGSFLGVREDRSATTVRRQGAVDLPGTTDLDVDGAAVVDGVRITHPDRLMVADGPTKLELAHYYAGAAPHVLRHLAGRPLSLLRCPQGASGPCFWQRHIDEGTVPGVLLLEALGEEYVTLRDAPAIVALVQFLTVEFHIWGSTAEHPDRPDRIVFDLDPGPGVDWNDIRAGALLVRETLRRHTLESVAKTTGGGGLHVVAPIAPLVPVRDVARTTKALAQEVESHAGGSLTIDPRKSARSGRIFLDWHRNSPGQSAVAPYIVRARPGGLVSTPITWEELIAAPEPLAFTPTEVLERLRVHGDPWERVGEIEQHLAQEALDL